MVIDFVLEFPRPIVGPLIGLTHCKNFLSRFSAYLLKILNEDVSKLLRLKCGSRLFCWRLDPRFFAFVGLQIILRDILALNRTHFSGIGVSNINAIASAFAGLKYTCDFSRDILFAALL